MSDSLTKEESDTPRTDAEMFDSTIFGACSIVKVEFARRLERDLNAMTTLSRGAVLEAALQWRPIETAPKDGYFLVWCPDERIGGLIEHWSAKNFHDAAMRKQWAHLGIPTHWMPIPEAPRS
jgi:hypothetical protein